MDGMLAQLIEVIRGVALFSIFGLSGGFVCFAFSHAGRALLAPICGMAVLAVGIGLFYSFAHLSFQLAASLAAGIGTLCTVIAVATSRTNLLPLLAKSG